MKRIACIVEGYVNQTEANAICLNEIIEEMNTEVLIDVITIESNRSGWNNNIYSIDKSKSIIKNEFIRKVVKFTHMPIGNKNLSKLIAKETNKVLNHNKYDTLMVIVNPIEAADAICLIREKNPDLKIILYEIDPASNRYKNPKSLIEKLWKRKSILWEKHIYKNCDEIIHMKSHYNHFSQNHFSQFNSKTHFLDIPNFKVNVLPNKKNNICQMVYAGAFYPVLRNPFPMIDILKKLSKIVNIEVHIYTGNNMKSEIEKSVKNYEMFHVNDYVSQEELMKIYTNSDILLDLGNMDSDYLPSKPFQYMGTGKPVIHFKQDESDVTIKYFKKYKNALIVSLKNETQGLKEITEFINNMKNKSVSYTREELENLFYENTPKYTAEKLLEIIR